MVSDGHRRSDDESPAIPHAGRESGSEKRFLLENSYARYFIPRI